MRHSILAAVAVVFTIGSALGSEDLLSLARERFRHADIRTALRSLQVRVDDLRDEDGKTALHLAAERRQFESILLILQAGADVNAVDHSGQTPLFYASKLPDDHGLLGVELLLLAGANPDARAADGTTPLIVSARHGAVAIGELLLWRGASLVIPGVPDEFQPLAIARQHDQARMVALLEAAAALELSAPQAGAGAKFRPDYVSAVRAADLNAVEAALDAGEDVNRADKQGATALFRAVAENRPDLVTLLLVRGADPKRATSAGKTPLMESMRYLDHGGTRMKLLLLLAGADVNATAANGATALSEAVKCRNDFGAKWMIWRDALLDVKTPEGTLMQIAKKRADWPSVIELLKKAGVPDDEALPQRKEDPFFDAIRAGNTVAVANLLRTGLPASTVDAEGCSGLAWAAHYGRFDIVDLLLKSGADVNQRNTKSSKTVLHELARWGRATGDGKVAAEHMQKLLDRGADPNLRTNDGMTALMMAARSGTAGPNFELLLQVTSEVDARNAEGKSALGIAREFGFEEVARRLVEAGLKE